MTSFVHFSVVAMLMRSAASSCLVQQCTEAQSGPLASITLLTRPCHLLQLLACIGEQFTEGDEICGIVVNVRAKQDKVCVWTKTAANEAAQVGPCSSCTNSVITQLLLGQSRH